MKLKHKLLIFVLTFAIVFGVWFLYEKVTVTGFAIANHAASSDIPAEGGAPIQVYFCPRDDCKGKLIALIESSENIDCAFYDLTISEVKDALKSKNYRLVVDKDNAKYVKEMNYKTNIGEQGLMHDKFCVFDNANLSRQVGGVENHGVIFHNQTVFTGSFNPTSRQNSFDANNVLIINSKYLAENYETEFEELWSGRFAEGEPVKHKNIYYNSDMIENYFCPEDSCSEHLITVLKSAQSEIKFLTFSFTHDEIGNILLEKARNGIAVSGVFDKAQAGSEFSEFHKLNGTADVRRDNLTGLLHHKVFIIDRKIVATGSFNPSKNADTKNDENLLIIHSPAVAEKYLEEFGFIWNQTTS